MIQIDTSYSLKPHTNGCTLIYSYINQNGKVSEKKYHCSSLSKAMDKYISIATVRCATLIEVHNLLRELEDKITRHLGAFKIEE